jgi:hypothetical protein
VINRLAVVRETGGTVRHQPFPLRGTHGLAEVGFAGFTELTLATFRSVQRNDVIAWLQAGHTLAHFHHDPAAFMAEYRREYAFRIVP